MSSFDEAALQELLVDPAFPKVSVLMPTHGAHVGSEQDPIRFEQLARAVADEVTAIGLDRRVAQQLGDEIRSIVGSAGFWRSQLSGLAAFANLDDVRWYRLPVPVDELVVVGDEYQVVPLVKVARPPHFAVLAVSRAGARLFVGTPFELEERELPDAPESLGDITQYYEQEKQLQFRQASAAGPGGQTAIFHGHGIGEGRDKELVLQYLRGVDRSVRKALAGENVHLVVAGPSELPGLFQQISDYGAVVDRQLEINPDPLDAAALRPRAFEVVEPLLGQAIQAAQARFSAWAGTGKASDQISELLPAAAQGRVDTLLVGSSEPMWGTFDISSGRMEEHQDREGADRDLVNSAAIHTLQNGGQVVEVGEGPRVAAIFRF